MTKTVDRRLRQRLDAAIMAKPFLEQVPVGKSPKLPPSVKQLSLQSMGEHIHFRAKHDTDKGDVKNVHARTWMPTLPVIHLAVALNVLFELTHEGGLEKLALGDLVRSEEVIKLLVKIASDLEPILLAIPRFHVKESTLFRFRIT